MQIKKLFLFFAMVASLNAMEDNDAKKVETDSSFYNLPGELVKSIIEIERAPTLKRLFMNLASLHTVSKKFSHLLGNGEFRNKNTYEIFDIQIPFLLETLNVRRDVHAILGNILNKIAKREIILQAERETVNILHNLPAVIAPEQRKDLFVNLLVPAFNDCCPSIAYLATRFSDVSSLFMMTAADSELEQALKNPQCCLLLQELSNVMSPQSRALMMAWFPGALTKNQFCEEFALESDYEQRIICSGSGFLLSIKSAMLTAIKSRMCTRIQEVFSAAEQGNLEEINRLIRLNFKDKRSASVIDHCIRLAALHNHMNVVETLLLLQPSPVMIRSLLYDAFNGKNEVLGKAILPAFKRANLAKKEFIVFDLKGALQKADDEFWRNFSW